MAKRRFKLSAKVSSDNPAVVRSAIKAFLGATGTIKPVDDGFEVEATLAGESARDLNRIFLSAMRRLVKKTRLRAEWTAGGVTERFFDYGFKGMGSRVAGLKPQGLDRKRMTKSMASKGVPRASKKKR